MQPARTRMDAAFCLSPSELNHLVHDMTQEGSYYKIQRDNDKLKEGRKEGALCELN